MKKNISKKRFLLLIAILLILTHGCTVNGAALFQEKGCANCHSFQGKGGRMGPDLTAVGARMSRKQIRRYIQNPAAQNLESRMPALKNLSLLEIHALAAFLHEDGNNK